MAAPCISKQARGVVLWRWADNAEKKFLPRFSEGLCSSGCSFAPGEDEESGATRRWCLIASASTWTPAEVTRSPWRRRERKREREGEREVLTPWHRRPERKCDYTGLYLNPLTTPGSITSLPQVLPLSLRALDGPHASYIKEVFHRSRTDPESLKSFINPFSIRFQGLRDSVSQW